MKIWCPASYNELRNMLAEALAYGGPAAIRYPKGKEGTYREGVTDAVVTLRRGSDLAVITYGTLINEALSAADALEADGIRITVVKLGIIAPLDITAVEAAVKETGGILTVEESAGPGSIGEALAAGIGKRPFRALNLGNGLVRQGTVEQQRHRYGIDADGIALAVRQMLQ